MPSLTLLSSSERMVEISSPTKVKLFLKSKGIDNAEEIYGKLDDTGLDKIERLMSGDITSNAKNYFLEFFEHFVKLVPAWRQSSVGDKRKLDNNDIINLFWEQFTPEQNEKVLVIRKQNSGNCYLHAPVVLEHYLIAIATNCESRSMTTSTIDIGRYENFLLSGNKLINFLLNDEGGNSLTTLKNICNLKSSDTLKITIPDKDTAPTSYSETCEILLKRVAYQPALVSAFQVFNEFRDKKQVSFSRNSYEVESDGDDILMHSMVLIGARKSSTGEYFFLLQNWWEGKYFIEVSGEYMHLCDAKITFVKKAITRKYELTNYVCDALYSETTADASETFYERVIV